MSPVNCVDKFGRKKKNQRVIIRERRGLGFKLTDGGDYDMRKKRLVNLGEPEQSTDATTIGYVDDVTRQARNQILKALTESASVTVKTLKEHLEEQVVGWKKIGTERYNTLFKRLDEIEDKHSALGDLFEHNRLYIEGQINQLKSDTTTSGILQFFGTPKV